MKIKEKLKFFLGDYTNRLILTAILPGLVILLITIYNLSYFSKGLNSRANSIITTEQKKQLIYSDQALRRIGENMIKERANDVKYLVEGYLEEHPDKSIDELRQNPNFRKIAIRQIGQTGYTAIHDVKGVNYFHIDSKVEGTNLKDLQKDLPGFWKIIEDSVNAKDSSGYYQWKNPDGKIVEKYMYVIPLEGKNSGDLRYLIAATIEIEEFTGYINKVKEMQKQQNAYLANLIDKDIYYLYKKNIIIILLCLTGLVFFSIFLGKYFTRAINSIEVAIKKVDQGDLSARATNGFSGTIGQLVDDFNEMLSLLEKTTVSAYHDQLTGLYNRRAFLEYAYILSASIYRRNGILAIMIIDLNKFKQINDNFGHQIGDGILIAASERFKAQVRKNELLARIGGDEFVILAEINDPADAELMAKRLKDAVNNTKAKIGNLELNMSISIGYAISQKYTNYSIADLLRQADENMYEDKNTSR